MTAAPQRGTGLEAQLQELEARLARAEAEIASHRRSRRWLTLAGALALALLGLTSSRPARTAETASTVKAPFRVVDDHGQPLLEVGKAGIPYLRMFSASRTPAVEIYATKWGGGLNARNQVGRIVAVLDTREKGVNLCIYDDQGKLLLRKP